MWIDFHPAKSNEEVVMLGVGVCLSVSLCVVVQLDAEPLECVQLVVIIGVVTVRCSYGGVMNGSAAGVMSLLYFSGGGG